jgi:hypothetical protein
MLVRRRSVRTAPPVPAGFPLAEAARTVLDDLVPTFHHRIMAARAVAASSADVAAAIRTASLDDAPLARGLMAVRTLGRAGDGLTGPFAERVAKAPGFLPLGGDGRELAVGMVGQPWPGGRTPVAPRSPEEFHAHQPDDDVKVGMSIRCAPTRYGTLLVTETRIVVGELSDVPFRRYWRVVRPGSELVRASLLAAIARRAEGRHGGPSRTRPEPRAPSIGVAEVRRVDA